MLDFDCGCESRKDIMFTSGKLGTTELAIVAVILASLYVGWRLG